jgi:hypothetical protein
VDGQEGNSQADLTTLKYLDCKAFDQVFRVLYNILPLLKSDKLNEIRATVSLASSIDLADSLCSICMDCESDTVLTCAVIPRQHSFCSKCIAGWSVKDKSCPMCRMSMQVSQGFLLLNSGLLEIEEALQEGIGEVRTIIQAAHNSV